MTSQISERTSRCCPVCGTTSEDCTTFIEENIDRAKVTGATYASRKQPEFMNYRLVRCPQCSAVFAPSIPATSTIVEAYNEADYDSSVEAQQAAATYAQALTRHLQGLRRAAALEVGTGSGALLAHFKEAGFARIVGIEPSKAAIAAADTHVRPWIIEGIFRDEDHAPSSFDLVCCFMTFEHVAEPRELASAFHRVLADGGKVAIVVHNYQAPLNRLLGRRSPIIDIEHLQLFCPDSIRRLLGDAGFTDVRIEPLTNAYRLSYWLRLLPLPSFAKRVVMGAAANLGLAESLVSINVGNMLCIATKPALP